MGKRHREYITARGRGLAALSSPPRSQRARDLRPVLGQVLRSSFVGLPAGPWHQHVKAEWLGPYTPTDVDLWQLKLMRRDPQIKLGRGAIHAPFFGTRFWLREGSPATRAFVEKVFLSRPIFVSFLEHVLNALDYGFQPFEIVWGLADVSFREDGPGGTSGEVTRPGAYVVEKFLDLDPAHVTLELDELLDLVRIGVNGRHLERDKFVHAVHEYEHQNPRGASHLLPAYNPWYWVNFLYLFLMRYSESRITPPVIGTAPADHHPDNEDAAAGDEPSALAVLGREAASLRNGSVALLPYAPDPQTGNNQFSLNLLQDAGRVDQYITCINHLQALKLRALCLPERAATQDTETGSFAMVREHVDFFLQVLEKIRRTTVIPALNVVVEKLVRLNFGSRAPVPVVDGSELARQKSQALFELVSKALEVPVTLEDGRTYTPGQLIDFQSVFESFNVPIHQPSEVAQKGAAAGPDGSKKELVLTPTDVATITTVNEARASVGLPPLAGPDGELTLPEYKAKHATVIAEAADAESGEAGAPAAPVAPTPAPPAPSPPSPSRGRKVRGLWDESKHPRDEGGKFAGSGGGGAKAKLSNGSEVGLDDLQEGDFEELDEADQEAFRTQAAGAMPKVADALDVEREALRSEFEKIDAEVDDLASKSAEVDGLHTEVTKGETGKAYVTAHQDANRTIVEVEKEIRAQATGDEELEDLAEEVGGLGSDVLRSELVDFEYDGEYGFELPDPQDDDDVRHGDATRSEHIRELLARDDLPPILGKGSPTREKLDAAAAQLEAAEHPFVEKVARANALSREVGQRLSAIEERVGAIYERTNDFDNNARSFAVVTEEVLGKKPPKVPDSIVSNLDEFSSDALVSEAKPWVVKAPKGKKRFAAPFSSFSFKKPKG